VSGPAESRRGSWPFRVGSALIVLSFALYPSYPLIALLPLTVEKRVFGELAAWAVSWSLFAAGTALAGRDALDYLKRLVTRRIAPRPK
jgi:hypothetical protein